MQKLKRKFLHHAKKAGWLDAARRRSEGAVRILCYHGIWLGNPAFEGDAMFMRAAAFRRRLELIQSLGYKVVRLDDAVAALSGCGPALPRDAVVITIDDGWASTATHMLPELAARDMPATIYCDTAQLVGGLPIAHIMVRYLDKLASVPGATSASANGNVPSGRLRAMACDLSRTAEERLQAARELGATLGVDVAAEIASRTFDYMTPAELVAAQRSGFAIELHTHNHTLGDLSEAVVRSEIAKNRGTLARLLGRAPSSFRHFCYPSGIASVGAARTLSTLDLDSSTTTRQGLAWPGMPMHLLPRLLDGDNLSEIEFEAELAGFGDWMRLAKPAPVRALIHGDDGMTRKPNGAGARRPVAVGGRVAG